MGIKFIWKKKKILKLKLVPLYYKISENILIKKIKIKHQLYLHIQNIKNNLFIFYKIIPCFYFLVNNTTNTNLLLICKIKESFKMHQMTKILYFSFFSKLKQKINGITNLYTGVINIVGLGFNVNLKKNKLNTIYKLFFRFGFKDTCTYLLCGNLVLIKFENQEKLKIITEDFDLLKKIQLNIQRLRYPKPYKLQGIYLNDIFPKVKKYRK